VFLHLKQSCISETFRLKRGAIGHARQAEISFMIKLDFAVDWPKAMTEGLQVKQGKKLM